MSDETWKVGDAVEFGKAGGGYVEGCDPDGRWIVRAQNGIAFSLAEWEMRRPSAREAEDYCDRCHHCNASGREPYTDGRDCGRCSGTGDAAPHALTDCPPKAPKITAEIEAELDAKERGRDALIRTHYPGTCTRCGGPAYVGVNEVVCAVDCERRDAARAAEVERIIAEADVAPAYVNADGERGWNARTRHGGTVEAGAFSFVHPTRDGALAPLRAAVEAWVRDRKRDKRGAP